MRIDAEDHVLAPEGSYRCHRGRLPLFAGSTASIEVSGPAGVEYGIRADLDERAPEHPANTPGEALLFAVERDRAEDAPRMTFDRSAGERLGAHFAGRR